jgi:uncharacterized protein YpmB
MPLISRAETYFIIAMMILILIVCAVSVYAFVKTYKKEMKEKREREAAKNDSKANE